MQIYIGNKRFKKEGSQLTQLISCCNFIKNIKYDLMYNVSEEEYKEKQKISLEESNEYILFETDETWDRHKLRSG
jgi:hypothetical protein